MNKKLIIAIIAGVVALALIVTAAVVVIKKININTPDDDSSTPTSSVDSDKADGTGDGTTSDSTPVVDKGNVTIGNFEGKTGDVIDVPIKLSENPGIWGGRVYFEYDASTLEYLSYEKGDILDEYEINATAGEVACLINNSEYEDTNKNGTLIVLQFKIKDSATKGEYIIKYNEKSEIANFDEVFIKPQISDGKITVK